MRIKRRVWDNMINDAAICFIVFVLAIAGLIIYSPYFLFVVLPREIVECWFWVGDYIMENQKKWKNRH